MSHEPSTHALVVVDRQNKALAVMDREQVLRQGLFHRQVLVLLTDQRGNMILRKRGPRVALYPGRWDCIGSADLPLKSAAEDMAWALMPEGLDAEKIRLRHVVSLQASQQTDNAFVEIFCGQVDDDTARALLHDLSFLAVDRDELRALVISFPDQLTPTLLLAASALESRMASGLARIS